MAVGPPGPSRNRKWSPSIVAKPAAQKWEAAMGDHDGGLSLISAGVRRRDQADEKQDQLQREILAVQGRLLQLARSWVVDPDANIDREKRIAAARKVLDWLRTAPAGGVPSGVRAAGNDGDQGGG